MSLVLQYKFDQADVTLDSSGSSLHSTNIGVTSTVDATYGNVASFSDSTGMTLNNPPSVVTGTSPRTFSVWINVGSSSVYNVVFDCGTNDSNRLALFTQYGELKLIAAGALQNIAGVYDLDTWYHVVLTFDGTTVTVYRDGTLVYSLNHAVNTNKPLYIGSFSVTDADFQGKMSDFRIYNYSLDSSEVSTLYSNGPGSDAPLYIPPLYIVPRSTNMPVTFTEVAGATGYNVTIESPTGGEITVLSGVTELEHNITGLHPETQYTVRLYADTGTGYDLIEEEVITTLANVAANYDVTDFESDGIIDLTSLPDSTVANITEFMNEIFTTGDLISIFVAEKPTSFIKLGEKLSISNLNGVLLPFVEDTVSGQYVNLTLSDGATDVAINFNETVNNITVNNIVYSSGDSFILDGKKVTVLLDV